MKKSYLLLSLFFCASILVISCTKGPIGATGTQGSTGPKGDNGTNGVNGTNGTNGTNGVNGSAGTDGSDGTNGADGADGAQGPAGTANVIYSDWFANDGFVGDWRDTTITTTMSGNPEILEYAIKIAPDVTAGILDSGIVLSYVKSSTLISPQLLPWIFSIGGGIICQLNIVPQEGSILYYLGNLTTLDATFLTPDNGFLYRYIIIPGGVMAGGRKMDPKTMSYSDLCRTYNIPY